MQPRDDEAVRTTVNIDDSLLQTAREAAARSGRTLGAVVDDALRLLLAERPRERAGSVQLPVYGGSGLQPGVDLEDSDALATLLDVEVGPRAAG